MPSRLTPRKAAPYPALDEAAEKSYQRFLAFLSLASGPTIAIAHCSLPSERKRVIQRVSADAAAKGVAVKVADISSNYTGDFVAAVKAQLDGHSNSSRMVVMLSGIGAFIYQSANQENRSGQGKPPIVARLNFERKHIARSLPFPIVFWLERESLALLLKQAPDFTQWISGHFHFGGPAAGPKIFDRLMKSRKSLLSQPAAQTCGQVKEFIGLLQELKEARGRGDAVILRKRLAVLNALGMRCSRLSDARLAKEYYTQVLEIARKLNDRHAEACGLGNLGLASSALGSPRRAIDLYEQALAISREIGEGLGESTALGNLGVQYKNLGETHRAIEYYEQSLRIDREIGHREGEGNALNNLGVAYCVLGNTARAIEFYHKRLVIARAIDDRRGEGQTLGNLGAACEQQAETRRAIKYYEQDLKIAREIGDRRGECGALGNLGNTYATLGEAHRAIQYYQKQLLIARKIGDRKREGNALANASLALDELGKRPQAIARAGAALKIFEQIEDPIADKVRLQLAAWREA